MRCRHRHCITSTTEILRSVTDHDSPVCMRARAHAKRSCFANELKLHASVGSWYFATYFSYVSNQQLSFVCIVKDQTSWNCEWSMNALLHSHRYRFWFISFRCSSLQNHLSSKSSPIFVRLMILPISHWILCKFLIRCTCVRFVEISIAENLQGAKPLDTPFLCAMENSQSRIAPSAYSLRRFCFSSYFYELQNGACTMLHLTAHGSHNAFN